jgi:hypothetical protein
MDRPNDADEEKEFNITKTTTPSPTSRRMITGAQSIAPIEPARVSAHIGYYFVVQSTAAVGCL